MRSGYDWCILGIIFRELLQNDGRETQYPACNSNTPIQYWNIEIRNEKCVNEAEKLLGRH